MRSRREAERDNRISPVPIKGSAVISALEWAIRGSRDHRAARDENRGGVPCRRAGIRETIEEMKGKRQRRRRDARVAERYQGGCRIRGLAGGDLPQQRSPEFGVHSAPSFHLVHTIPSMFQNLLSDGISISYIIRDLRHSVDPNTRLTEMISRSLLLAPAR